MSNHASIIDRQATMEPDALRREVAAIKWWHQIELGQGIVTPGTDNSREKLARLAMPDDLRGWSVLDIGAWDGFFSFEAEQRGALRVLAVDHASDPNVRWGGTRGFELARRALNSRVQAIDADLMSLTADDPGQFDLVLFLGVLYHMKHPLLALERVAAVTRRQLILETHVDLLWSRRPAIAYYPERELKDDDTNWCGPNPAAVAAMLRTVGFRRVETVWLESPLRRLGRAFKYVTRPPRRSFWSTLQQGRLVVHAWK